MTKGKPLQLFYPAVLGRALDVLRTRLSLETIERDESGNMACYNNYEQACVAALKLGKQVSASEMYLVVITIADDRDAERVRQELAPPLAVGRPAQSGLVLLSPAGQEILSTQPRWFGLEIVPGTEHRVLRSTRPLLDLSAGADDDDEGDWF